MKLIEFITVTPQSNNNLMVSSSQKTLLLPYDVEMTSANNEKALHKQGTKVLYQILNSAGNGFKLKIWRTAFSTVLSFDSKDECEQEGFDI